MSGEGVTALSVYRLPDGRAAIMVDSLVELFDSMARDMAGGPVESSFRILADSFRPMSSYANLVEETKFDDGSTMLARRCSCGATVIDGRKLGGKAVAVDAEPDPAGLLFPMNIRNGVPTLAPWGEHLDGIDVIRLREHQCEAVTRP